MIKLKDLLLEGKPRAGDYVKTVYGIGKINKEKSSDYRLKVYVSFGPNLTYNYELQSKLHSLSLIPVLSLPLKKLSY